MAIVYRSLRDDEIPAAAEVYLTALTDMQIRNGLPPGAPSRASMEQGYRHVLKTGIFEVAEVDGQLSAVCCAVVRDDIWFLSGFWVLPGLQRQKIGGPLLRRVWAAGEAAGARTFFVWASRDNTAMASYMKLGMLPGTQLLKFSGPLAQLPEAPNGYTVSPLLPSTGASVDRMVRGTGRETDHHYLREAGHEGFAVLRGGLPCGYYYVNGGNLGSVAWLRPEDGQAVMAVACRDAAGRAGEVSLTAPGCNHLAVRTALGWGLQLTGYSHFLTTGPVGRLEQYLPSGPLVF